MDQIHFNDKVHFNKVATYILHRNVSRTQAGANKMQDALFKMEKQLKHERLTTRSRYLIVKEMEQKFLQLEKNPQDYSHVKQIIDDKNKEITTLKKKLKDLESYPVQTLELISSNPLNKTVEIPTIEPKTP